MKLTKTKLKQLIKEELSLMGSLEIENNFVRESDFEINDNDGGSQGPNPQTGLNYLSRRVAKLEEDNRVINKKLTALIKVIE